MKVTVLSPSGEVYSGKVDSLKLPAQDGGMEILRGHAPIVTNLGKGALELRIGSQTKKYEISSGFLEVQNDIINILTDSAK